MTDEKRDEGTPPPANDSVAPAEAEAGATPGGPVEGWAAEEAKAEIARLKDQLLRALAETENVRRRAARDREDALRYAASNFAKDMLTVSDNLARALQHIPAEQLEGDPALKSLYEGVAATERQLLAAFERHGIKRIDPLGEKFDPHLHQAMLEVPGSGQPAGTVAQVLQPGYVMHDRLLRAAMVGVAKADPGAKANGEGSEPGSRIDTVA